ncbi:heme peroxidase, partial [Rhizoclosmatium hyalinum]
MLLQDPEDPQNKGLQRAIDALAPLYDIYDDKISNADLWSYAGALAVRVMGGPVIPWRPGRNDITDIKQARLGEANRIPSAKDSWKTQLDKFAKFGMNRTDLAALIHGGHGPVNGASVMELPSDLEVVMGITDAANAPKPGTFGPNADQKFLAFSVDKDYFYKYFTDVFVRLLEVTLDNSKLGGYVSTDPTDPFGWVPVKNTTATQSTAQSQNQANNSGLVASKANAAHMTVFVLFALF